jgi:urease accessory protein
MRKVVLSKDTTAAGHHAPIFGLVCLHAGLDIATAQKLFLFHVLRDMISAAVRLAIFGPLEGALLQRKTAEACQRIYCRHCSTSIGDLHQTNPLLELIQGKHESLYSRLFSS